MTGYEICFTLPLVHLHGLLSHGKLLLDSHQVRLQESLLFFKFPHYLILGLDLRGDLEVRFSRGKIFRTNSFNIFP